jgi:membrane-bound ClpP family serine protease
LSQASWWLITIIIVIVVALLALVIVLIVRTYKRQAATGREDFIGKTALVKEQLAPEGIVLFQGELWTAVSISGSIEVGEEALITKIEGMKLIVTKIKKE